jgi:hypothetical protein
MEYPILGWDARIPSWDGMYGMSHPGMGCMGCPILGWDVNNPILGWEVNNPILGWDVWDVPSWDGMQ